MQESLLERIFGAGMASMLLIAGIYLTVRFHAVQLRRFIPAFHSLKGSKRAGISVISAACTNLGATVGMGNVIGVAVGISVGGAGCILWMLIAAFFGMAIRYAENYFGVKTRNAANMECSGGPFIYIETYMPLFGKKLGRIYAFICLTGSLFGMGAALQARCIRTVWSDQLGGDPFSLVLLSVLLLAVLAPVLIGGSVRIAKCAERIVPFMMIAYLVSCVWILVRYSSAVPSALLEIVRSGLSLRSAAGASVGVFLRQTVLTGIRRGLFSNEAGLGLGAITAASAPESDAETAGDIGVLVTFLDTFVICSLTGLCLLVTRQSDPIETWRIALPWMGVAASYLLPMFLTLFALTSIFGSAFYAESCLRYLSGGDRSLKAYRIVCLLCVGVGVFLPADPLWRFADLLNAGLALLNLTALIFAVKESRLSNIGMI